MNRSATGVNLLKVGCKRRRTKQEIKQQKLQEEQKLQEVEAKMAHYD